MDGTQPLGRSDVQVPRLGVGVMTWGRATGGAGFRRRFHGSKTLTTGEMGTAVIEALRAAG